MVQVKLKAFIFLKKIKWADDIAFAKLLISSSTFDLNSFWIMAALAAADTLIFDETMKCVGVTGFMAKGITYLPQITHLSSLGWYNSVTYEIKSKNPDFLFIAPCIIQDRE